MRLRYKASAVVICFVAFYMGVIPIYMACVEPADVCALVRELMISTRLPVPGGGEDIEVFISDNILPFTTMIITPACIILVIAFLEKRKNSSGLNHRRRHPR